MKQPAYIVASGWWCPETQGDRHAHGSAIIRSRDFHALWYQAIVTFTNPQRILIVDNASPVPPPPVADSRRCVVRLAHNAGHPTSHVGCHSGWTEAVLMGMLYTLCSEAEYFVFVEQDALLFGRNIIEHCIASMRGPFMFGASPGDCHPLQQAFFIVHRRGLMPLIERIDHIKLPERLLSPERKFCLATSPLLRHLPPVWFREDPLSAASPWLRRQVRRTKRRLLRWFSGFDPLPVGYGGYPQYRPPMDLSVDRFYFQHGSLEDIRRYIQRYEETYGPAALHV